MQLDGRPFNVLFEIVGGVVASIYNAKQPEPKLNGADALSV